MAQIIMGYYDKTTDKFYTDSSFTTVIPANQKYHYRNNLDGKLYVWTGGEYLDAAFYSDYKYVTHNNKGWQNVTYDNTKCMDANHIYLAAPGHRIIGAIQGVDEDSCSLSKKLNNTDELSFTLFRVVDGEVIPNYNLISRHQELYIPGHGWFKITEEPEIENDGTVETKSVTAESGEIELQQYDLVSFYINTGAVESKEMLATDNTYEYNEYYLFRDNVRFWWDTRDLEQAILDFTTTDGSVEALKTFVNTHTFLIHQQSKTNPGIMTGCWRITRNTYTGEIEIDARHYTTKKEDEEGITYPDYTGTEILSMELKREHELSLLWLVLHEHGWSVGYVDDYYDESSTNEDDRYRLADKVSKFEVDSQDSYSFLTQDLAQSFRCIFVFDTDNYQVNCYNINNLGYDTHIFLNYRNVQNELTRSGQKDLYTVFHVQGSEDLDFTEANFGENYISDISFFLNTHHFSKEFIEKYNYWLEYRNARRLQFMELSIAYRDALQKAQEIYDRVPVDGMEGNQYTTMSEDELRIEKSNMIALKRAIEKEFTDADDNIDWDALKKSSEWAQYQALVDVILSAPDVENTIYEVTFWEDLDVQKAKKYGYDFPESYKQEHPDARLGNIDIALLNRWIVSGHFTDPSMTKAEKLKRINVSNQMSYLDNYQYDFKTYGHMYGLRELQNQSELLFRNLTTLSTSGFDKIDDPDFDPDDYDPSQEDEASFDVEAYKKYLKYMNAYEECQEVLLERQAEYNQANSELDEIQAARMKMVEEVQITNEHFGFTEEELKLLDKYYIHTDYVNENILVTDQYTNEQIVSAENQLYLDASEELYVESHPQFLWTTTQDNLLLMPEFQRWHGELHVGNFIWVTFREDYGVKLRISEITFNPLMINPDIQINFTTMTTYRSTRNDYTDLLARANASNKNRITAAISKSSNKDEDTINIDTALVLRLLQSVNFTNYVSNVGQNANSSINSALADVTISAEQVVSGTLATERLDTPSIINAGESSVKSIISDSYIKESVINNVSISDIAGGDIALSEDVNIVSSEGDVLLTDTGITATAIPEKIIDDNKLNFLITSSTAKPDEYSIVTIPVSSEDTFGTSLVACINKLFERIKDLEDRVSSLEE